MRNDSPAARDFSGELENAPATISILPSSSAAMRCTGPMNAPGPPPANPMRSFRCSVIQSSLRDFLPDIGCKPILHRLPILRIAGKFLREESLFVQEPPDDRGSHG